jgi:hypothetical protein
MNDPMDSADPHVSGVLISFEEYGGARKFRPLGG